MKREELVRRIKEDTSSGAAEIMKKTVEALLFMSDSLGDGRPEDYFNTMIEFGCELILAQPAMAPVFNAVNTVILEIESGIEGSESTRQMHQRVDDVAGKILTSSQHALAAIGKEVAELIADGQTVLTHSYSSTAIGSLVSARKIGRNFKVIATESRPLFEGRRTAHLLSDAGIDVALIADMAAFHFLDDCDLVLTGCDCICHKGVVNKVGTKGLAAAASHYDVPFFIATEMNKVLPAKYLLAPEIAKMGQDEIWHEPGDVAVRKVYFDITEHIFFKGYITEKGITGPSEVIELITNAEVSSLLIEKLG